MKDDIYLSIVIPAYKEQERIKKILQAVIEYEADHEFYVETIVVVDGSPDSTAKAAEEFKDKIRNLKIIDRKENKGKGYAWDAQNSRLVPLQKRP